MRQEKGRKADSASRASDEAVDCPLAAVLAERLREARDELTRRWLERIVDRVSIDPNHVFPTDDLLDHVPLLVDGIADYMENPADEISADVPVIAKAMELGEMRQAQGFSAHEILKEYEILGGVIFSFLVDTVDAVPEDCTRSELLACGQRLFRAISVIQQVTTAQYLRVGDEAVREREERLRSFNRLVTHELKNRLSAIRGASDMLSEPGLSEDPEKRSTFLEIIARNADAMHDTLQDLLRLTQMEGDSRKQRNVRLPEAVAESARQLREMALEAGVTIRLAEDLPDVEVDAAAIELCLVNLISNAIKYRDMDKPERWVAVRARLEDTHAERELVIAVEDNGVGVPPEARAHLFERFYRASPSHEVEGSGLGLSIVRDAIEQAGGRVWGEFPDGPRAGATFMIALPARRALDET